MQAYFGGSLSLFAVVVFCIVAAIFEFILHCQGCKPPTSSNIENWLGRNGRWRNISHGTWGHLSKKYSWLWLICLNYSGIPEFMRELNSHVNGKITSNNAKNWNFRVGESSGKFSTLIWRPGEYGPESGVSQIIRESWQHCHCRGKLGRVEMVTGHGLGEVGFFFRIQHDDRYTLTKTIRTLEENTCNTGHSHLCRFLL